MTNYVSMWTEHKLSVLLTMCENAISDLENGYDPHGNSINKQVSEIAKYASEFGFEHLCIKSYKDKNGKCKRLLIKSGAISE